jgi:hypothetical protein
MSSNINYLSINEQFPVAGQDNDTQVFRDNFDTIKSSLNTAKTEITDLINNTAKLNEDNDFEGNVISNAKINDARYLKFDGGVISGLITEVGIEYSNGVYQVFTFGIDSGFTFNGFSETDFTKISLELTANSLPNSETVGSLSIGTSYKIISAGDAVTNYSLLGATSNTPGTVFQATETGTVSANGYTFRSDTVYKISSVGTTNWAAVGWISSGPSNPTPAIGDKFTGNGTQTTGDGTATIGDGVVQEVRKISFISTGGLSFRKSPNFPNIGTSGTPAISLDSPTEPIIVEIWKHDSNRVFINYLGKFN